LKPTKIIIPNIHRSHLWYNLSRMANSKKKIVIDQDKCIGCNTCPLIDPDTFELDSTTYKAIVKKQPNQITDVHQTAVDSCPVGAISIVDEE